MNTRDLTGQTLGQYELRELIGAGGMGTVYRAYQASLKRVVAVKVLPTELSEQPGYIERFTREATTVAALEHAHIVPIYDYGTQRNISYVVMRLLTGGSLVTRLAQRAGEKNPLPSLGETADLLNQLASALDYAHSQGVIHRDIKPGNVMFDNQGSAYLMDFGIAKLIESTSHLTGTGMTLGTPAYMAPEQWRSEEVSPATDQYALGVMIYQLVTGRLPFEAPTPYALMHKHLNELPTPPNAWRPGVPDGVVAVVQRAMAKKAEGRFPSITAFALAFSRAIQGVEGQATNMFSTPLPRKADVPTSKPMPATVVESGSAPPATVKSGRVSKARWAWITVPVIVLLVAGIAYVLSHMQLAGPNMIAGLPTATVSTSIAVESSVTAPATSLPSTGTQAPTVSPTSAPAVSPTALSPTDIENTVQAVVNAQLTENAKNQPTPDIQATANSRLTATQRALNASTTLNALASATQQNLNQTATATLWTATLPPPATFTATLTFVPATATPVPTEQPATKITVTWFIGLGTGFDDPLKTAVEQQVVDAFNASHRNITLQMRVGKDYQTTLDTINALLAAGNGPDIVGPVGFAASNPLADQYLDLKPLMDKTNYELRDIDPALLEIYRTASGGYRGIPFAVYPTVMYYNTFLFDQAGLKYPPSKFGDKYTMPDGTQLDWTYDTVARIARLLTLDRNGNSAISDRFDPRNIVQYGLNFQWATMRRILTSLQPAVLYDRASNKVNISNDWRRAAQWLQDGLWKEHFILNAVAEGTDLFRPSAFDSGRVAMAIAPTWYACCMTDTAGKLKWNLAVVPVALDGSTHIPVDADTFFILKSTRNPDAAFTALSYLVDQAVPKLAPVYGIFTARTKYQPIYTDIQNRMYPQQVLWRVAADSLKYANPAALHHESYLPHFQQTEDRFGGFYGLLFGDRGANMNVNSELDILQSDLQAIVNAN